MRTLHAQRGRRAGKNAMGRSCSAARLDEDDSDEAMVVVPNRRTRVLIDL